MGSCSSGAATVKGDEAASAARAAHAKKQRRKLSVAPNQVGDISPVVSNQNMIRKGDETILAGGESAAADAKPKVQHASLSRKGVVPYNKNKVNQDRFVVKYGIGDDPGVSLFAVMDGHGENGHFVAQFVQDYLPSCLGAESHELRTNPEVSIQKAVASMVTELAQSGINTAFSGSTLVFGVKIDKLLYVGNVGDSRFVMCRKRDDGSLEALQVTRDHKPDVDTEKERILKAGGRVERLPADKVGVGNGTGGGEEVGKVDNAEDDLHDNDEDRGPMRVWLADADVPGLAMSRSIGDEVSQRVGVIPVPEIFVYNLDENDLFGVFASDGVWEFISNDQAVQIVYKHRSDWKEAARQLVDASQKRWREEEEVVDDITCVIVNFNCASK